MWYIKYMRSTRDFAWVGQYKDFGFYFEMRNHWRALLEKWHDPTQVLTSCLLLPCSARLNKDGRGRGSGKGWILAAYRPSC